MMVYVKNINNDANKKEIKYQYFVFQVPCGTMTYNLNGQNLMNGNQGSFNDVKSH